MQFFSGKSFPSYLLYAIGEIFLVVIGILLALQINTWNEARKDKESAVFLLTEVRDNLEEDAQQIEQVIHRRTLADSAIYRMIREVPEGTFNPDSLKVDLGRFLTFERYFPVRNGYEMLKSAGLKSLDRKVQSRISRYYDFEQNLVQSSIRDIESVFIDLLQRKDILRRHVVDLSLGGIVEIRDPYDPEFVSDLMYELTAFKGNNGLTLVKVKAFRDQNEVLIGLVEQEISRLAGSR